MTGYAQLMSDFRELDTQKSIRIMTAKGFAILRDQTPEGFYDGPIYEPDMPFEDDFPVHSRPWTIQRPLNVWGRELVIIAGGFTYADAVSAVGAMRDLALASESFAALAVGFYARAAEKVAARAKFLDGRLDDFSEGQLTELIRQARMIESCARCDDIQ